MTLSDRTFPLRTPDEVDAFLARHREAVVFKAGLCHKSPRTFEFVQGALENYGDVPVGVIRVVESRTASNHVEKRTGIRHESPQVILFKDGVAVFDRDNWDITREDLDAALRQNFAAATLTA